VQTAPFTISENVVSVHGQPLKMAADGFQILYHVDYRESVWLRNNEGYYFLESMLVPSSLKRLRCGNLSVLNHEYARDEKTVFQGAQPIPDSDPATFIIVADNYYFAYDRNQVYALSGSGEGLQIWRDVDTASLAFFPKQEYFADKNHLYYFNWHFIEFANHSESKELAELLQQRFPQADAWWNWSETYYLGLVSLGHAYFGDGRRVFYRFQAGTFDYPFFYYSSDKPYFSVLANADANSFIALNAYYGKDKHSVYHLARPIAADLASFYVIGGNYAADRNGIWFNGYFCSEADASSFEIVGGPEATGFAKDERTVFSEKSGSRIGKYQGYSTLLKPLRNSAPDSFEIINDIWARDKNNVYCHHQIWSGIDAGSFEFLFTDPSFSACSYAKCKNGLYDANGKRTIKGIDGASFVMLNRYWGKDKNGVFFFKTGRIYKSIDVASFEVLDANGLARDKNFEYAVIAGEVSKRKPSRI